MDGFQKITFDAKADQVKVPVSNMTNMRTGKKSNSHHFSRKRVIIIGSIIGVIVLFVIFGILIPGISLAKQAQKTIADAKAALTGMKQENIQIASDALQQTQTDLVKTQADVDAMWYLRFVPVVNFYYNDGYHLLQAGKYGLNAGQILVSELKPYADVLGLKGQGTFVGGTAQQRIQTAVTTMSKVTPKIDDIEQQIILARNEIDQVDPNHYPPLFGAKNIHDQLTQLKTITDASVTAIQQAKPLIKILPNLLGEPNSQKYLILFQNPGELRATGGFLTDYAIFRLEHGVINVEKSADIYELDATVPNKPVAPRPILQYLPNVPVWNLRDTNISPDFVVSMDNFTKLYKTAGEYTPVSGIIGVDTKALVDTMNILGDITVDGQTYTTQTDPHCNCPQVIYQMELYADQPLEYFKVNRKGIIADLMYAIMQKAFSSSPRLYWGPLFQSMITDINQKHILFDLYNSDAQGGLAALNATGQIIPFDGDYLHINDVNFGGQKSNLFITESVDNAYQVQGDGSILKTITITYKNPFPPSDCNLEHGQLCLNAIQRDWLRVYVPKGSQLVSTKGSEVKVTSYDELGKTVFEGFLTVRPLGSAVYTLQYKLPFKLASDSQLPLLIQKQPGTDNNDYTITVNNNKVNEFPLLTDKTLKLSLH